ncbi:MAG: M20 family metallopeptidase [Desulforhopalus sp.]
MPDIRLQQEILELTKKLISYPSTNSRPEEIHNCAVFIEQWLDRYNIPYQRTDEGRTPSINVLPKPGYAPVLLMTHFDVVESDDPALFIPVERDNRLFGRGAIDDKYGVALSLVLLREHLRQSQKDGHQMNSLNFGLLMTGDEETGGANGAKKASDSITTDFFLVLDGGNPGLIVTKEKGVISLELNAMGIAAHAARPWLGKSAFDILLEDYTRISTLFPAASDDPWHRTMVLTKCKAGNGSSNIVPAKASAMLDIRYTENDDADFLVSQIESMVKSDLTVHAKEPVFMSGPSTYLDLLVDHSDGAAVGFEHGASDARYFSSKNIPGAIWGADGEMSQHTSDEHIVISSLYRFYDRLDSYLNNLPEK